MWLQGYMSAVLKDFRGRNIRLCVTAKALRPQSFRGGTAGAAVTIGGPSGAIEGFTITGTPFIRGLDVVGDGCRLISGNIFEGQAACLQSRETSRRRRSSAISFGTTAASIHFSPAVVVFINMSSPRIVNNIFVNNTCVALDLSLPQFNAPQVINNTFVNNRVAIHVDRRVPQATARFTATTFSAQNGTGPQVAAAGTTDADNPVWTNNLLSGNTTDYAGTNITGDGQTSPSPIHVS